MKISNSVLYSTLKSRICWQQRQNLLSAAKEKCLALTLIVLDDAMMPNWPQAQSRLIKKTTISLGEIFICWLRFFWLGINLVRLEQNSNNKGWELGLDIPRGTNEAEASTNTSSRYEFFMTLRELEALHSNGPISQMIEKNFQNPLRASLRIDAALLQSQSSSLWSFKENQWEKISHFTKFPTFRCC